MEIKRKGITLKVNEDYSYDANPRNNDNLGTMVCFHSRYRLGDETDFEEPEEFLDWLKNNEENIVCKLPIYLLDHSGLFMSTIDFHDPWDSGQVGIIYCTKKDVDKFELKDKSKEEIAKILTDEVKDYSNYLSGYPPYYYFCLRDEDDEIIDSMSGFCGDDIKQMFTEMKTYTEDKYHFLFDALYKKEQENCL